MLTPSFPCTPDNDIEVATTNHEESPITPDEVPTFTNRDRPVLQPYGSYGARFVIEPSTEESRLRARAAIFGDASSPSSDDLSGTPESQQAEHWSGEMAALQSQTERLKLGVKRGLKKVQDSAERRVRKVKIAEQIVFQIMGSVRRRGAKSELPSFWS